jgi:hypothetical protein
MNEEQTSNEIYHPHAVRLQKRDDKPIIGISVAISIGVLALSLCVCLAYALVCRRRRRNESTRSGVEELPNTQPMQTPVPTPSAQSALVYNPVPRYPDSTIANRQITAIPQSEALGLIARAVRDNPPSSLGVPSPTATAHNPRRTLISSQQTSRPHGQSRALTRLRPTQALTTPPQETRLGTGETLSTESNTSYFDGGSTQSHVYEASARRDASWAEFTHARTQTRSGPTTSQRIRFSGPSGNGVINHSSNSGY